MTTQTHIFFSKIEVLGEEDDATNNIGAQYINLLLDNSTAGDDASFASSHQRK